MRPAPTLRLSEPAWVSPAAALDDGGVTSVAGGGFLKDGEW